MLTLISSKVVEKINLENISNHVKGKEVIGRSQHIFMKRKLCLMNGIVLHDEVIGMVKDGWVLDVIYLNFKRILLQNPIKAS